MPSIYFSSKTLLEPLRTPHFLTQLCAEKHRLRPHRSAGAVLLTWAEESGISTRAPGLGPDPERGYGGVPLTHTC